MKDEGRNNKMQGQFLLQRSKVRPCWNLRQFCCPTLEGKPPSLHLIRHEVMVEEYHQFGILLMQGQFLLQRPMVRPCWNLRQFCFPTLEGKPPSLHLIRHEPMVEEYYQFGQFLMQGQFLLQRPRVRPCWNLRQFCCPTLE